MKLVYAFRIPLVILAVAAAPAIAASHGWLEHADKVLEGAKATLSQATSTAETQVGGKALTAHLARRHGQDFYDVHVLKEGALTDVHVGMDGKLIATRALEHGHMTKSRPAAPEKTEQPASKS